MNTDSNDKIKVLITDDHALFRTGVKASLSHYPDIDFIGEAENGMQLLNLVKFLAARRYSFRHPNAYHGWHCNAS